MSGKLIYSGTFSPRQSVKIEIRENTPFLRIFKLDPDQHCTGLLEPQPHIFFNAVWDELKLDENGRMRKLRLRKKFTMSYDDHELEDTEYDLFVIQKSPSDFISKISRKDDWYTIDMARLGMPVVETPVDTFCAFCGYKISSAEE